MLEFKREGFKVQVSDPEMYVNNQARGRSGHVSHAMAEFAPGCMIDFNSNCSSKRLNGHAAFGWIEYRISKDAGVTYSESRDLPYAKEAFLDGLFTISVEKAVACDDGSVVAFCLRNDPLHEISGEPWFTPTAISTADGGETWTNPVDVTPYRGRIYDAVWHDGVIYVLEFCNDAEINFIGSRPDHLYRIFTSKDRGRSFEELSVVPIDGMCRAYGAMQFDKKGDLHVYAYNSRAERSMDHAVSHDCGKTWDTVGVCYVKKGIRNPQVALIDGVFVLHGRGEKERDFVLYTSTDGYNWDEGEYLEKNDPKDGFCACYYSNNIVLPDPAGGNRLLIQYSAKYELCRVNVMHRWLKITKTK